jgi:hypothetical protein
MHRFTVVVYVLALAHALGSGTDTSIPVVRYAMLATALPVLFLFALRLQRSRKRTGPSTAQARAVTGPESGGMDPARLGGAAPPGIPPAGRYASGLSMAPSRGQMEPLPSRGS